MCICCIHLIFYYIRTRHIHLQIKMHLQNNIFCPFFKLFSIFFVAVVVCPKRSATRTRHTHTYTQLVVQCLADFLLPLELVVSRRAPVVYASRCVIIVGLFVSIRQCILCMRARAHVFPYMSCVCECVAHFLQTSLIVLKLKCRPKTIYHYRNTYVHVQYALCWVMFGYSQRERERERE